MVHELRDVGRGQAERLRRVVLHSEAAPRSRRRGISMTTGRSSSESDSEHRRPAARRRRRRRLAPAAAAAAAARGGGGTGAAGAAPRRPRRAARRRPARSAPRRPCGTSRARASAIAPSSSRLDRSAWRTSSMQSATASTSSVRAWTSGMLSQKFWMQACARGRHSTFILAILGLGAFGCKTETGAPRAPWRPMAALRRLYSKVATPWRPVGRSNGVGQGASTNRLRER